MLDVFAYKFCNCFEHMAENMMAQQQGRRYRELSPSSLAREVETARSELRNIRCGPKQLKNHASLSAQLNI